MAAEEAQMLPCSSSSTQLDHLTMKSAPWPDNWISDSILIHNNSLSSSNPSPPLLPDSSTSSDPDSPASLAPSSNPLRPRHSARPTGRVTKRRKSRATKRSPTTYINADPANFRHMVQQVTGIWMSPPSPSAVLKPEPQRLGGGGGGGGGRHVTPPPLLPHNGGYLLPHNGGYLLPALDTSAFLLGHQQRQALGTATIGYGSGGDGGFSDLDVLPNFPTLESWGVI